MKYKQMKRTLSLILLMMLVFQAANAQQVKFTKPDHKQLKKEISGKNAVAYNRLMQRFVDNDTTLTLADYHKLYYGSAFKAGYNPMNETPLRDSLYRVFVKAQSGEVDFGKVKSLAQRILDQIPFDIRTLDPASYACRMLNDNATAAKIEFKMGRLIETIYNSGDGLTEETPFIVVLVANETDVIRALGFTLAGTTSIQSGKLHYRKVTENEFGVQGFYFKVL